MEVTKKKAKAVKAAPKKDATKKPNIVPIGSIYDNGTPIAEYKKEKGIPVPTGNKHRLLTSQVIRFEKGESILVGDICNAMAENSTKTIGAVRSAVANAGKTNDMVFLVKQVQLGPKKVGVRIWRTA